jgi:type II secretory pathway pseudopilin PulG
MTTAAPRQDEGFALLETIIAFTILSIALAVTLQTVSQSTRTLVRAGDMQVASVALDTIVANEFPDFKDEGTFSGQLGDGELWQATTRAIRDDHSRPLLAVTVTIWPRGREGQRFTYQTFHSHAPETTQ